MKLHLLIRTPIFAMLFASLMTIGCLEDFNLDESKIVGDSDSLPAVNDSDSMADTMTDTVATTDTTSSSSTTADADSLGDTDSDTSSVTTVDTVSDTIALSTDTTTQSDSGADTSLDTGTTGGTDTEGTLRDTASDPDTGTETAGSDADTETETIGSDSDTDTGEGACVDWILDGDFEAQTTAGHWNEVTQLWAQVIEIQESDQALVGDYLAWFANRVNSTESASVSQSVTIPESATTLFFFVKFAYCAESETYIRLSIDDEIVWQMNADDSSCVDGQYQPIEVDISDYANGGSHSLSFDVFIPSSAYNEIMLDLVTSCPLVCGNGMVEPFEQCDDGNIDDNDGCTGCVPDYFYQCDNSAAPSVCAPVIEMVTDFGDGDLASRTGGPLVSGESEYRGVTLTEQLLANIAVDTQSGTVDFEIWNNNFTDRLLVLDPSENADFSVPIDAGDYIVGVRALEDVPVFYWEMDFTGSVCGNGLTEEWAEECDDANSTSGDGCTACTRDVLFNCNTVSNPTVCVPAPEYGPYQVGDLFPDISAQVNRIPKNDYYIVTFSAPVDISGDLISPDVDAGADPDLSIWSPDFTERYVLFESVGNEINLSTTLAAGSYVFEILTLGSDSLDQTSYTLSLVLD